MRHRQENVLLLKHHGNSVKNRDHLRRRNLRKVKRVRRRGEDPPQAPVKVTAMSLPTEREVYNPLTNFWRNSLR